MLPKCPSRCSSSWSRRNATISNSCRSTVAALPIGSSSHRGSPSGRCSRNSTRLAVAPASAGGVARPRGHPVGGVFEKRREARGGPAERVEGGPPGRVAVERGDEGVDVEVQGCPGGAAGQPPPVVQQRERFRRTGENTLG